MVNYDAIKIGLEVEFMCGINDSDIHSGIVRYKGPINNKEGNWVGVEAKEPVGFCDGRLMGRFYFSCQENYGLFLDADDLRLVSKTTKRKPHIYKPIIPQTDELLFKKSVVPDNGLCCITKDYLESAKSVFENRTYSSVFSQQPNFTSKQAFVFKPKPKEVQKPEVEKKFHPTSSIPRMSMPSDELKLYTKLNWSYKNVALPRSSTSLNNTFDSFNKKRTNYIEPN